MDFTLHPPPSTSFSIFAIASDDDMLDATEGWDRQLVTGWRLKAVNVLVRRRVTMCHFTNVAITLYLTVGTAAGVRMSIRTTPFLAKAAEEEWVKVDLDRLSWLESAGGSQLGQTTVWWRWMTPLRIHTFLLLR